METHIEERLFRLGVEQFNTKEFFAAHETWEELWLAAAEPEKTFLQGIIQVAAALHHYTRNNPAGAQSLLRQGLAKLEQFPSVHRDLQLEDLRERLRHWLAALDAGRDLGESELPRIQTGGPHFSS